MKPEIEAMEQSISELKVELKRLVRIREASVGIDFKRTNYKIAELQNRIDRVARRS